MKLKRVRMVIEKSKSPNLSYMEVFNALEYKLTGIQKQLDKYYHNDWYLRDRLLTATDIT